MRIDHIGVAVHSIDEALALYRDVLGLDQIQRTVVEHERVEAAVLGAGPDRIELLQPTSDDSVIAGFLRGRGPGVHHVALQVDCIEEAVDALRRSGRKLVVNRIQIGAEGYRYVFVHPRDTGGVLLELVEREQADSTGAALDGRPTGRDRSSGSRPA